MAIVDLRCPSCGANINANNDYENGQCLYCGKQYKVEEAVQKMRIELSGKVDVFGVPTVQSMFTRAEQCKDLKDFKKAQEYYDKILEIEPDNHKAWFEKSLLPHFQSDIIDFDGIKINLSHLDSLTGNAKVEYLASVGIVSLSQIMAFNKFLNSDIKTKKHISNEQQAFFKMAMKYAPEEQKAYYEKHKLDGKINHVTFKNPYAQKLEAATGKQKPISSHLIISSICFLVCLIAMPFFIDIIDNNGETFLYIVLFFSFGLAMYFAFSFQYYFYKKKILKCLKDKNICTIEEIFNQHKFLDSYRRKYICKTIPKMIKKNQLVDYKYDGWILTKVNDKTKY